MAWSIKCDKGGTCGAWIEDNGVAHFPENTSYNSITYTITYTDADGNCGSTTITQPGGCSGGGGSTCKGTVTANKTTPDGPSFSNGGTLEIGGGALYFSYDAPPTPTPTPTGGWSVNDDPVEVIRIAKNNLQDGSLDDWRPLFKQGVNRTGQPVENALFCRCNKQCYYDDGKDQDYYSKRDTITIKITNSLSGLYIPFNASKFRVNGKYTCFRGVTDCGNGSMNIRYGSNTNKGFDTNFIVPPGKTITMNNCYVFSDASSDGRSAFGFGILKSDDYDLHTDDANTAFNDYFGLVYSYDSANKIATFNITGGTRWGSTTYHYALTNEDVSNGYVKFENGSKGYIVPIWIGKVANGTWSYTSDSAYAQTLPEGMSLS